MQKVTKDDLKGQVVDFPMEVLQKMCEYQEVFDPKVFQERRTSGFNWHDTKEGFYFWDEIIIEKNFALFFEKYPKTNQYPQVMWVWNFEGEEKIKRVVFMEKRGKFLAWWNGVTIEEAEIETESETWNFAEPIETITKKEAEKILNKIII